MSIMVALIVGLVIINVLVAAKNVEKRKVY